MNEAEQHLRSLAGITDGRGKDDRSPVGMEVPEGGSNCAKCKYLGDDRVTCANKDFIVWNKNSNVIPMDINRYCCNFFNWTKK